MEIAKGRDYRAEWREAKDLPEVPTGLPGTESPPLIELMRMTREESGRWTRRSAIRRAGCAGFKHCRGGDGELVGLDEGRMKR